MNLRVLVLGLLLAAVIVPAYAEVYFTPDTAFYSRPGTGGWIKFGFPITSSYVTAPLDNFVQVYAPFTGYTILGIDAPAGVNVTVSIIENYNLVYATQQSGAKTVRFYMPGRTDITATGADSHTWDQTTAIYTVTAVGASTVTLHWNIASGKLYDSVVYVWQLWPLVMLVMFWGGSKANHFKEAMVLMAFYTVAALIAYMFYAWGI